MTQPVQVAFVFENGKPKIFLRTLLYATGKRGYVIEGLYLTVTQGKDIHTFGFWGYGERSELMVAGGLRVTEEGVAYPSFPRQCASYPPNIVTLLNGVQQG